MRARLWSLILLGALLAAGAAPAQERPAGVMVDEVAMREIAETAPILGRLVAATRSVIAARVQGVIDAVPVRVGDRVAAGEVIARIDLVRLNIERDVAKAAIAQAQADLHAAEADVDLAAQALERVSRLRGSAAFSAGVLEDRQSEFARAESRLGAMTARVESAVAALARADYDLTHAVIRAPFDGVVIERHAQPGAYLMTGAPVATLLDVRDLEIEADVPTEFVDTLAPGLEVQARIGAGRAAPATVRAVVPEETVATRTRAVRFGVAINGLEGLLAAGQTVVLDLPTAAPRRALTVAKDALVQSPRGWTVFVAVDGLAEARAVEIGAPVADRFEVLSGLEEGEMAVVRGNERLRPGQPIAPRTAAGDGPPSAG